jgi:4-amino-4-deoxy-L-arabinose transferase-like glycosyltransferase
MKLKLPAHVNYKSIFILTIPLALSFFTHLWNPLGFPTMVTDEGVYVRRALHILEGLGPQESISYYDHPYFGPIFLATFFKIIGYPNSLNPSSDLHSIEMLYLMPKLFMGLLAVLDTFLVYKISERRYNRTVAFIASVLFAVMPITWLLRKVFLDSILLPFLLTSVLFAVSANSKLTYDTNGKNNKKNILILLSGVFLGLAIFTKIPAFTMMPLIGYLVYGNSNKNLKTLGLWFIPVILVPLIWPAYAAYVGDFDKWMVGVSHQASEREGHLLDNTINLFLRVDPVLLVLGTASIVFVTAIKRDFLPLLWVAPLLLLFYFTHYSSLFHFIPLIPSFCIATAVLLVELSNKISKMNIVAETHIKYLFRLLYSKLPFIVGAGVCVFGFVSTTLLITTNIASFQYKAAAFVSNYVLNNDHTNNKNTNNSTDVRIITSPIYLWLFSYVFHIDGAFRYRDDPQIFALTPDVVQNEKLIMMMDEDFDNYIDLEKNLRLIRSTTVPSSAANVIDNDVSTRWTSRNAGSWIEGDLSTEKALCKIDVIWYKGNERSYNFVMEASSDGKTFTKVLSGKSNGTTLLPEKYNFKNITAKQVKITVNGNTVNSYASIREINFYGYSPEKKIQSSCENLPIVNVKAGDNPSTPTYEKLSKKTKQMLMLYNATQTVATFNGTADNYNNDQYPYTSMGYSKGGSKVDVRVNK